MAIEPSPTPEATRFTDPERTSPATKMPGTLVSRGSRSTAQPRGRWRSHQVRSRQDKPLFISLHNAINQSVRGRAPIKMNNVVGTVSFSPVMVLAMVIASRLVSPLASTTLECTCTDVVCCGNLINHCDMLLARESPRTSMVILRAYLESTLPPVQPSSLHRQYKHLHHCKTASACARTVVYASPVSASRPARRACAAGGDQQACS